MTSLFRPKGSSVQPKRDADARGVPVWGLAALRSSSMAALAVFIFQCAGTDLYALTLYRDGHNLPAAVCNKTWVYRARREFTKDSLSSLPLDVLAAMDALIGDGFYMAKFSPGILLFPN
jgi:hypothetical protein